jgi:hypothetical protein
MHESQPINVDAHAYDVQPACSSLMFMAEREFAAFTRAVTELFGPEEARLSAEDWLNEVASTSCLPGPTTREWRMVTVASLARLTIRMATDLHDSVTNS